MTTATSRRFNPGSRCQRGPPRCMRATSSPRSSAPALVRSSPAYSFQRPLGKFQKHIGTTREKNSPLGNEKPCVHLVCRRFPPLFSNAPRRWVQTKSPQGIGGNRADDRERTNHLQRIGDTQWGNRCFTKEFIPLGGAGLRTLGHTSTERYQSLASPNCGLTHVPLQ